MNRSRPTRWPQALIAVPWWSLGGVGTFVAVLSSRKLGDHDPMKRPAGAALTRLRWLGAMAVFVAGLLGFAQPTRAAPAKPQPVSPAKAKPAPAKPAPAQPAKAQPAKIQPATTAKPAKLEPSAPAGPAKITGAKADPFAAGDNNPNIRQSELYGDRLDNLQAEVDQLKDKIFRSKARLTLLKETVLRGVLAGSRVTITHQNLMGSGFRLVKVVFIMDGAQIFARTDETGSLDGEDEIVVYDGNLPPGPHNVTVKLMYQGNGYGVFSYLNGYEFTSNSSHSFTAPENAAVKLVSQGFERGNMTTEMGDRPAVNWQEVPLDAAGRPMPKTRNQGRGKSDKVSRKKDAR